MAIHVFTFFLLYINDIPDSTSIFEFILYADDSTLSASIPEKTDCLQVFVDKINSEFEYVYGWLNSNNVCLNVDEMKYLLFSL